MITSYSHVPGVLTVEYRTTAGEVRHKTFHADCSVEDDIARNYAPDDNTPLSSTPEGAAGGSPYSADLLEYEHVLEYREINRHARRKIEAWSNSGWCVSWKWNGRYNYKWRDSRRKSDSDELRSAHWMTLRRSRLNLSSSPSGQKVGLQFPKTPKPPLGPLSPVRYAALYSDSDSEGCSDSGRK